MRRRGELTEEREVRFRWSALKDDGGWLGGNGGGERRAVRREWIAGGEEGGEEGAGRPRGLAERTRVVRDGWLSREAIKLGGR